jgi:hypothetical protein
VLQFPARWFRSTDHIPARHTICHPATRRGEHRCIIECPTSRITTTTRNGERRVRGSVDSSVPGITSQRPRSHRRLQMSRHPPRITRQTPMSQNPFLTTKWGLRVIGAGRSDPLSEVTIRRASSRVSRCAAERRPGSFLEIDVGQRLPVSVADDEAGVGLLAGPQRRAGLCSGVIRRLHRHGQADKGEWSNLASWRL